MAVAMAVVVALMGYCVRVFKCMRLHFEVRSLGGGSVVHFAVRKLCAALNIIIFCLQRMIRKLSVPKMESIDKSIGPLHLIIQGHPAKEIHIKTDLPTLLLLSKPNKTRSVVTSNLQSKMCHTERERARALLC